MRDSNNAGCSPRASARAADAAAVWPLTMSRPRMSASTSAAPNIAKPAVTSAANERRIGPAIGSAGIPMPTVHPVTCDRLHAEYTGVPSRSCARRLPSEAARLRSTNSGLAGRPTYRPSFCVRATIFGSESSSVTTPPGATLWRSRIWLNVLA